MKKREVAALEPQVAALEPPCAHVWDRDWIDLTPDRSVMVYSCCTCHTIITEPEHIEELKKAV